MSINRCCLRRAVWISAPVLGVATTLGCWEVLTRAHLISPLVLPTMSATFLEFVAQTQHSWFWISLAHTLLGWSVGLIVAMIAALPLGMIIGSSKFAYRATRGVVELLRPIPSVALIPAAILITGIGYETKILLVLYASFWPIFIQTLYGVRDTDPVALDTARSFGMGRVARILRIRVPSSLPYVATGVRISSAIALILAVTEELIVGTPGLGESINVSASSGSLSEMYALIVATGCLGWFLNAIALMLERRLLKWHVSYRPNIE